MSENPPAFPQHPSRMINDECGKHERTWGYEGMSLRDYFAGQAIEAAWAAAMEFSRSPETPEDFAAKQAYAIADAMLAARSADQ